MKTQRFLRAVIALWIGGFVAGPPLAAREAIVFGGAGDAAKRLTERTGGPR